MTRFFNKCLLLAGFTALAFAQMASAVTYMYVVTNAVPLGDGTVDWAHATNSLQGAINAIAGGTLPTNTVFVSNGVYDTGGATGFPSGYGDLMTNRIAITKAITVRSANNDPVHTIIKGRFDTGEPGAANTITNGPAAVRCVMMIDGSSLIGFTLTNGATFAFASGGGSHDTAGGGVQTWQSKGIISNCIITGNSAYNGGGAYYGILYNCTVVGNSASSGGGGVGLCALSNCTLVGNQAVNSGGADQSTLYNCMVVSNSATSRAGGVYGNTLYNCTVAGNRNSAGSGGGGIYGGTLYNCIVYFNSGGGGDYANSPSFTNCCSPGLSLINGNITNDPMFVNTNAANYRLSQGSPCINAGANQYAPAGLDLDGHRRLDGFSGLVDMGCYEFVPAGTMFRVR